MPIKHIANHKATAIFLPSIIGLGGSALAVRGLEEYGWALFLALPLLVSFLSAFLWSFRRPTSFGSSYGMSAVSILALGGFILIFALDGLICLLMALPLALVLALIGTALGRVAGSSLGTKSGTALSVMLTIMFPALLAFEHSNKDEPLLRIVTTSIEIDASIESVWNSVIAFPKITDSPKGIFRFGIAYPIEATIDGTGIGAIRRCTFSTGSFVEPITVWKAPHHLSFDVTENPPPMTELSIFRNLEVPHLRGHMISKKGEFRIEEKNGKVILHGTTWYHHTLSPQFYWGPISDQIIHQIHNRVLTHIKTHAEKTAAKEK